jgi:hypothetical protein
LTLLHRVWQAHHVPPCVYLGRARPTDRWCDGCRVFIGVSEQVQGRQEQRTADRIQQASRHR